MRHCALLSLLVAVGVGLAAPVPGCGQGESRGGDADGGASVFGPTDASFAPDCVNLCRQQITCVDTTTSVSGTVRDPAGKLPLYNAIVYVPNAPVGALASGASCDRCGTVAGSPLVATLTDAHGFFELKNVPAGKDIPLVVQIGKWRRQLVVPNVASCLDTRVPDVRMPRNRSEGDIPQLALTTGGDDAMECWLRKVGLDDAEFTTGEGAGRVHLYAGSGAGSGAPVTTAFNAANGGATFSGAQALWSDPAKLARYDVVLLACEGQTFPATKPPAALAALEAYAHAGGRVLASHWQRFWFDTAEHKDSGGQVVDPAGAQPSAFAPFSTWNDRADPPSPAGATLDTSTPKGAAMAAWLGDPSVLALDPAGLLPVTAAHHNVDAVATTTDQAMSWATIANASAAGQPGVTLLSSNVPNTVASAQKCGRVAYAALHASPSDARGPAFPDGCASKDMSPAEKALEMVLFDLASCISDDRLAPTAPRAR